MPPSILQPYFQKAQRVPFLQSSALWDFSDCFFFVSKFGFLSEPARLIRILFFRTVVFRHCATFFQFVFIDARQLLLETKRFASIENSLGFSGLCVMFRKKKSELSFKKVVFCFQLEQSGFRVLSSNRGILFVSGNCFLSFSQNVPGILYRLCAFWALDVATTLDVSVLFSQLGHLFCLTVNLI